MTGWECFRNGGREGVHEAERGEVAAGWSEECDSVGLGGKSKEE